jgi:hypothetical protein
MVLLGGRSIQEDRHVVCELTSPVNGLIESIHPVPRLHPLRLFEEGDMLQEMVHTMLARCKLRAQGFKDFPHVQHLGINFHQRRLDLGLHNPSHVINRPSVRLCCHRSPRAQKGPERVRSR